MVQNMVEVRIWCDILGKFRGGYQSDQGKYVKIFARCSRALTTYIAKPGSAYVRGLTEEGRILPMNDLRKPDF
jgi:hypothetical protein